MCPKVIVNLKSIFIPECIVEDLGCWNDQDEERALPDRVTYEGSTRDKYEGCKNKAKIKGYSIFALQYGGQCWMSSNGESTYSKYGRASGSCEKLGGTWVNHVYKLKCPGKLKYIIF